MDCKEFRERLDLYADGELSRPAAEGAREHSKSCASCARAEGQLRRLRASLKRAVERHRPPDGLEGEVLRSLRSGHGTQSPGDGRGHEVGRAVAPLWRAKVNVPVPLFALLVLSLLTLAGWLAFARGRAVQMRATGGPAPSVAPAPPREPPGGFDLSRYYGGERASIKVVRRASLDGPVR